MCNERICKVNNKINVTLELNVYIYMKRSYSYGKFYYKLSYIG